MPFPLPLGGSLIVSLALIVPVWRIFVRAGLNPALSLLIFIPVIGFFVVAAILGLSRWGPDESEDVPPAAP